MLGILWAGFAARSFGVTAPLNVVFVLIDDMGWKDLGCYGGQVFETPNIDRLAAQGMRFTDAYAACSVCAPTRASLITGKYPGRLHFTALTNHHKQLGCVKDNPTGIKLIQPEITEEDGVQPSEYTIANAFRDAGYRTALFGKTHFGSGNEDLNELGFDVHEEPHCDMWITPPTVVPEDPKRMTTITDLSINFMRESVAKQKPFFLYVPHNAVHVQVQATQPFFDKYNKKLTDVQKQDFSPHYVAMVEELDREVGRLLDELDALGIAENTVIIFTSDNGGVDQVICKNPYELTSMAPLRGQKGGQYEGSHRVPLIIKWPGQIKSGSVSHEVVITPDYYPTCLEMAGLPLQPQQHLDGISIVPALKGGALGREAVYWHKPHYYIQTPPMSAVRCGYYTYIMYWETELSPAGGRPNELFDLEADIGETENIIKEKPEVAARLHKLLMKHIAESGCEVPQINPQYVFQGLEKKDTESSKGWNRVDDFESYQPGSDICGRNGWAAAAKTLSFSARVVSNPHGKGQVLEFRKTGAQVGHANLTQTGSGFLAKTREAPQTVFVRFMFSDNQFLKGAAKEFAGFGVAANTGVDGLYQIKQGFGILDADGDNTADTLVNPAGAPTLELLPDVWYSTWLLVDNREPDCARLYIQSDEDSRYIKQRELIMDGGWLSGPGAMPYAVFVLTANHASGPVLYVDDMFYDNSGMNLSWVTKRRLDQ